MHACILQIPLIKGAFDMYPFDHYDSEIAVYVYTGPTYSNSSTELALIVNKAISYGFTFSVGASLPCVLWSVRFVLTSPTYAVRNNNNNDNRRSANIPGHWSY